MSSRSIRDYKVSVLLYVALVCIFSLGFWVLLLRTWGPPNFVAVFFFWALHMVAHLGAVEVALGGLSAVGEEKQRRTPLRISGGALILMTAAFGTPPSTAATVAIIPVFRIRRMGGMREDPVRMVFNTLQEVMYAGSTAAVYWTLIDGQPGLWWRVFAAGIAILVGGALNAILVGGAVAVERSAKIVSAARQLLWPFLGSLAFGVVSFLVANVYTDAGYLGAVLIVTPLLILAQCRRAKIELDEAQERTLRAFVRAIELKDPYTSRHSERVAEIVLRLHRKLGTDPATWRRRYYGALMHDLGKIAVPGAVLTKPTRLSQEEFKAIRIHPEVGARVAGEVDALADLAPEILAHHERLDGRGYPRGLVEREIPFAAKVLAVADVFEALTSDRPYRMALSGSDALALVERMGGSQLDEVVVGALGKLVREGSLPPRLVHGPAYAENASSFPMSAEADG